MQLYLESIVHQLPQNYKFLLVQQDRQHQLSQQNLEKFWNIYSEELAPYFLSALID